MSYLEGYGVREARTEKYLKYGILTATLIIAVAFTAYFILRDRSQRGKVEDFLARLRSRDYKSAYALWGCTDAKPCPEYPMNKFLEDWGPASPQANIAAVSSETVRHCDSGILQILRFPDGHEVPLWVQRRNDLIGFAPWEIDAKSSANDARFALRTLMRNAIGDCSDLR